MKAVTSIMPYRVVPGLPVVLAIMSLLAGCTLPQAGGVGTPNLNPATRGPLYYRYIPSAAHQIGPNLPFPGPSFAQQRQIISVAGFNGAETETGIGKFVKNFYAGGFPAVQASVERCYAISEHYFEYEYGFMLGQVVPCEAEDTTAYAYNTLLTENWGFPSYPFFSLNPFARRSLIEFKIAHQSLASAHHITDELTHDILIILPTEIELPVAEDRP
jgi:hypothetical protein